MAHKILVIEDEIKILDMIENYLAKEMFVVSTATDGKQGVEKALSDEPDLILLDLMLPKLNGLDVCRKIRKEKKIPIIMLTAKSQEVDKLLGLELGADDYITKPFSLAELTARIRAVLRRIEPEGKDGNGVIHYANLKLNIDKCELYVNDIFVSLTPTEFKILSLLLNNIGRVYSRYQLLTLALNEDYAGYERSIDTHIRNLRKKIEPRSSSPDYLITVYGFGYRIKEI